VPNRSPDQRLRALQKANTIRANQAQLKKNLKAGTVPITRILEQPPAYATNLAVETLLRAIPGYGPARVARLLTKTRISASKRLGGLTDRQRIELINHFHH
jgi:hypothetical protein